MITSTDGSGPAARASRRWWAIGLVLLLVLGLVGAGWWWSRRGDAPTIPAGPSGAAFYSAPEGEIAKGEHGTVIWRQPVVGAGALEGARTDLVLYRSTGADGRPTAVSGLVSVPVGTAPEGGWPVISWAHGTTGLADVCAPSRASLGGQTRVYSSVMDSVLEQYVAQGYAVVRTDYEGLGTPGPHPYLMGESAGAAVTDVVAAAHELHPGALSSDWVAAGHSQGGQAALFASRYTGTYSPGLHLKGVVAISPPSQLGAVLGMTKGGQLGSASFLGPLIYSAALVGGVDPASVISARGMALVPQLEERCITELSAKDSFGGLGPRDFLRPGADLGAVRSVVEANDASSLTPRVPVLLVHGSDDELVPRLLSDNLSRQYEAAGVDLDYRTVPGADHVGVLLEGRRAVDRWLETALPAG